MTFLPFICLAIGIILGVLIKDKRLKNYSEKLSTIVLALLMITIGLNIGIDTSVRENFAKIGLNCVVISLMAIGSSVLFIVLCEKTVLPLKSLSKELEEKNLFLYQEGAEEQSRDTTLIFLMPVSIILGLILGRLFQEKISSLMIDKCFTLFLILLYVCVGISQGTEKGLFKFLKLLGVKIVLIPLCILVGSITGGIIAGKILNLPAVVSVISASGMGYYSITGAFMTNSYGLEVGAYGFIVNILREMLTILLMPFLIKISLGSPIAGGGAGNMDTMLMPVTKFVGAPLGVVTLFTGTILTVIVPFLLPLLASIL